MFCNYKLLPSSILLLVLVSCQAVPQSVADSQTPPSAALRQEIMRMMKGYRGPKTTYAKISSVVVWDAKRNINAFCIQTQNEGMTTVAYSSISTFNGKLDNMIQRDRRCLDKRLRYYDFPEMVEFRS